MSRRDETETTTSLSSTSHSGVDRNNVLNETSMQQNTESEDNFVDSLSDLGFASALEDTFDDEESEEEDDISVDSMDKRRDEHEEVKAQKSAQRRWGALAPAGMMVGTMISKLADTNKPVDEDDIVVAVGIIKEAGTATATTAGGNTAAASSAQMQATLQQMAVSAANNAASSAASGSSSAGTAAAGASAGASATTSTSVAVAAAAAVVAGSLYLTPGEYCPNVSNPIQQTAILRIDLVGDVETESLRPLNQEEASLFEDVFSNSYETGWGGCGSDYDRVVSRSTLRCFDETSNCCEFVDDPLFGDNLLRCIVIADFLCDDCADLVSPLFDGIEADGTDVDQNGLASNTQSTASSRTSASTTATTTTTTLETMSTFSTFQPGTNDRNEANIFKSFGSLSHHQESESFTTYSSTLDTRPSPHDSQATPVQIQDTEADDSSDIFGERFSASGSSTLNKKKNIFARNDGDAKTQNAFAIKIDASNSQNVFSIKGQESDHNDRAPIEKVKVGTAPGRNGFVTVQPGTLYGGTHPRDLQPQEPQAFCGQDHVENNIQMRRLQDNTMLISFWETYQNELCTKIETFPFCSFQIASITISYPDSDTSNFALDSDSGDIRITLLEAPSAKPSSIPSFEPSNHPSVTPSFVPTGLPSQDPSAMPTSNPSSSPSMIPSESPTSTPSSLPSAGPSTDPSSIPSHRPTGSPSSDPSLMPSLMPTITPSTLPSDFPLSTPSHAPSLFPSADPSESPSAEPSDRPSNLPSTSPSNNPSIMPSPAPSDIPSVSPTRTLSESPTETLSESPTETLSESPTKSLSESPTKSLSESPTKSLSESPTKSLSESPTESLSESPTESLSETPSKHSSDIPTLSLTINVDSDVDNKYSYW